MISLDTETTGLDFDHGTRPFFVTTCEGDGTLRYWEWDVDPLTRMPLIPPGDVREIGELLFASGPNGPIGDVSVDPDAGLILHNAKFDIFALASIGMWEHWDVYEVWRHVIDTQVGAHLIYSNKPRNLTDCAQLYLQVNIQPLEKALENAVKEARRLVRTKDFVAKYGNWNINTEDHPMNPSNDKEFWRADYWLPRAVAKTLNLPAMMSEAEMPYTLALKRKLPVGHPWWTVLRDYGNADSGIEIPLWKEQRKIIEQRNLGAIFAERMRLPAIFYRMEDRGVTVNRLRLDELTTEYREESERAARVSVSIAKSFGHDLVLPKSGVNNSLRELCFDKMKLEHVRNPKSKTNAPSLDAKVAIPHYKLTLPITSKERTFICKLEEKRSRDTAIIYMEGYKRFWIPMEQDVMGLMTEGEWYTLCPDYRQTGTDTLRAGCKYPNVQNVSKKESFNLRKGFGPGPGREWYSLDAKGIEDRLPAYESLQEELIEIFENSESPPYYGSNHLLRFHTVYPDIWDAAVAEVGLDKAGPYCKKKYGASYYQWCKNGGFAVQYGAVEKVDGWGTADRAFHKQYSHRLLKQRFSKLEALNQKCIRFANKYGYVETIPDKSVDPARGYPIMCTRTERGYILETVPLNYHIQGSAMWWTARAMVRCQEQLDEWNRQVLARGGNLAHDGYFMAIQVHDEIVFDFPKRAHPKTNPKHSNLGRIRVLQRLMEKGGEGFGIPTPVGVEFNEVSWSEGVTL